MVLLVGFVVVTSGVTHLRSASRETNDAERNRVWDQTFADHLPEYCKYTQALPDHLGSVSLGLKGAYYHPLSTDKYQKMFGKDTWVHMHHHCQGLEFMYRAMNHPDPTKKIFWYRQAVTEFDYVINRARKPYLLHAEGLFNKGIAFLSIQEPIEGVNYLSEAIQIDPRYLPAYVALANYFQYSGDLEQAASVVQAGLEQIPDSAILRAKLAELQVVSTP
jgi:tetratricopeptide (TPR) repeat protein